MILVACVRDAAEAAEALACGFDGVARSAADGSVAVTPQVGEALRLHPVDAAIIAEAGLPSVPQGCDGLLLRSEGRLLDAVPIPVLARLASQARARGVVLAFAGALEAPDVPRLAAAGANMLLIGRALRHDGRLDSSRMAAVAARPAERPIAATGRRDRIFVRDLLLAMEIGAYRSERGRRQRVRVSVEAEIEPVGRPAAGMADIVSYDLIVDAVSRLACAGHVDLVETFAEAIAAEVLGLARVALVTVRVEKLDLGPGAVGVEVERERPLSAGQPIRGDRRAAG